MNISKAVSLQFHTILHIGNCSTLLKCFTQHYPSITYVYKLYELNYIKLKRFFKDTLKIYYEDLDLYIFTRCLITEVYF